MSPKQKKLAAKAPPPNKLDEKDFKVLREEKAKGRGMGLQDEKVQPGKVMKARVGKSIKKDPTKTVNPFEKKSSKFMERRKALGTLKSSLKVLGKAGKVGALLGAVGAAGAGAAKLGQTIGRKMSEKKDKKMGGGMMKKYSSGGVSSKEVYTNARANVDAKGKKNMTMNDLKEARRETYATKKMSGGMMKKYSSGGESSYTKGYEGRKTGKGVRESLKDKVTPMKKERLLAGLEASGKMSGGMMKKYSKGGGADSGTEGERRSAIGVFTNKVKRFLKDAPSMSKRDYDKITERTNAYALAQSMKDKDRLTDRDIKKASSLVKGKMGGGMIGPSQRPGYSKGTMVKARGCKLGRTRPTKIT